MENLVYHADLELNSQVVECLLELTETYSVVEISVEVTISVCHACESLIQLDPKQIKHSLKLTSRIAMLSGMSVLLVSRKTIVNLFGGILHLSFRYRKQCKQIQDVHELMQIDVAVWSSYLFYEQVIYGVKDMARFISSQPFPLCQRDQVIFFQQL